MKIMRTYMKNIRDLSKKAAFSLLIVSVLMAGGVFADSEPSIKISGEEIVFNSQLGYPFVDENGRTQVPLRIVMDKIGATTSWDPVTKIVTATKGDITVRVPIGTKTLYINGLPTYNDTRALIHDGRTFLPVRKVLELLGYDVTWDEDHRMIEAFKLDETKLLTKVSLPKKYDLREHGRVGAVKDQGESTDCWAYASASALESAVMPAKKLIFSPKHIADHSAARLIYEEGGTTLLAGAYFSRLLGPVLEKLDPSTGSGVKDGIENAVAAIGTRIIRNKDINGIKKAIYEKGAVTSSIFFDENSYSYNQNYRGSEDLDHSVTIIGWDDGYDKNLFKHPADKDGAFIVMNSYGTDFHDKGIFYVSYEDLHIGTDAIYFTDIEPAQTYGGCYSTFNVGATNWDHLYTNKVSYANVFNVGKSEKNLMTVGLASMNTNQEVKLYLIKDVTDAGSIKNGTKIPIGRAVLNGEGFFPVKLQNIFTVSGRFAILVEASTTDEIYKIPMEQPYIDWDKGFDLTDGEGYYESEGEFHSFEKWQGANLVMSIYFEHNKANN